jgi:hypothetical protein
MNSYTNFNPYSTTSYGSNGPADGGGFRGGVGGSGFDDNAGGGGFGSPGSATKVSHSVDFVFHAVIKETNLCLA